MRIRLCLHLLFALFAVSLTSLNCLATPMVALPTKSVLLAASSSVTTTMTEESVSRSGDETGLNEECRGQAKAFLVQPIGIQKLNCGIFTEFLAEESTALRFSRAGGASGDFLIAGEDALQAGLRDPALYGTPLTTTPTFNPALADNGLTIGEGLGARVQIGPSAFSSRQQLIETIIHEETHIRLDLRTAAGSYRSGLIQSARVLEEDYVESVAQRYFRRFGDR